MDNGDMNGSKLLYAAQILRRNREPGNQVLPIEICMRQFKAGRIVGADTCSKIVSPIEKMHVVTRHLASRKPACLQQHV